MPWRHGAAPDSWPRSSRRTTRAAARNERTKELYDDAEE